MLPHGRATRHWRGRRAQDGTATIDELQPIEDGLVFDEAMFGGLGVGLVVVVMTSYLTRRSRLQRPA